MSETQQLPTTSTPTGWRILSFGKDPATAAKVQERLRSMGYRATVHALSNDGPGDARLISALNENDWDGVTIGGAINGQDPVGFPATDDTTRWFNRILNIIHTRAPRAKIVLVKGPHDVASAIERELGPNP